MIEGRADKVGLALDKVDVDVPDQTRAIEHIELSIVVTSGPRMEFVGGQLDVVELLLVECCIIHDE